MALETDQNLLLEEDFDDTIKDQYLCFTVDSDEYAIAVARVKEIVPILPITTVPETPDYVKGIINLRGDILPVIGVRTRFGKPEIPYDENTCIIVITCPDCDYMIGLIVDQVISTYTITEDAISAPPNARLAHSNMYVKHIGRASDGLKLLLDLDKLIAQ